MCLAAPAEVTEILADGQVRARQGSMLITAGGDLIGEPLEIGDFVLIHAGFVLEKLDPETARQNLELHLRLREEGLLG